MTRRRIIGSAACALAMAVLGTINVTAASPAGHCKPLWTDPANDESFSADSPVGYQPQIDLVSGTMWTSGANLVVRFDTVDMSTAVPLGTTGQDWGGYLNIGTQYYNVDIEDSLNGEFFWLYTSELVGIGNGVPALVSGTIVPGPGGYAEIDVPLSLLGSPAAGTAITMNNPYAWASLFDQGDSAVVPWVMDTVITSVSTTIGAGAGCS